MPAAIAPSSNAATAARRGAMGFPRSSSRAGSRGAPRSADPGTRSAVAARAAIAAAATATAVTVVPRRALLALARGSVLGPLDQLLGLNQAAVLVLGNELEADSAPLLVDLLDDDV